MEPCIPIPEAVVSAMCVFGHFCHFYMVMGNPMTQPQLLTTNVMSLGPTGMIFLKKPRQIHYKSIPL